MKIKINPDYPPHRAHPTDAGLDLRATHNQTIHPHETQPIHTGVHIALDPGTVAYLHPRSSLGKRNLGLANDTGVIDANYRGEIIALIQNRGRVTQRITKGERITQLVIHPIIIPTLEIVDELDDTDRGEAGFGSTGTH